MASLAQQADRHMKTYFAVKEIVARLDVRELQIDIEDYSSDAHAFDVYSEDPEGYVAENGSAPATPLPAWRRNLYKGHGFRFRRDGSVEHD